MSYSLLGIFDVSMPVLYGEGGKRARQRLLTEIHKANGSLEPPLLPGLASDHSDIVNWLSPPDPWTNHRSARERHQAQTGLWFLESEQYRGWRGSPSGHLWLYGKAGCGKTILCSPVIEDTHKYYEDAATTACAAFYFSFTNALKQSYENLLRSLVAQLALVEPGLTKLRQAYKKPNASVLGSHELEEILVSSVKSYDKVVLLLDALDQCPERSTGDGRQDILAFLERFAGKASNLAIFATSRETPDITKSMALIHADRLVAASPRVDSDIRDYVLTQMLRDARLDRLKPALKKEVADTLAQRADGM